jgi:hypothetical protein
VVWYTFFTLLKQPGQPGFFIATLMNEPTSLDKLPQDPAASPQTTELAATYYREARETMTNTGERLTTVAIFVAGFAATWFELSDQPATTLLVWLLVATVALNTLSAALGVWVALRINEFLNKVATVLENRASGDQELEEELATDFEPWQFKAQLYSFVLGLAGLVSLILVSVLV